MHVDVELNCSLHPVTNIESRHSSHLSASLSVVATSYLWLQYQSSYHLIFYATVEALSQTGPWYYYMCMQFFINIIVLVIFLDCVNSPRGSGQVGSGNYLMPVCTPMFHSLCYSYSLLFLCPQRTKVAEGEQSTKLLVLKKQTFKNHFLFYFFIRE